MFVVKKGQTMHYKCYFDDKFGNYYYATQEMVGKLVYRSPNVVSSFSDLTLSSTEYVSSITEGSIDILNEKNSRSYTYERYSAGDLTISAQLKTYAITKRYVKHKAGEFNSYSYGVTGSPTVSADGLASGFSTANYLTTPKFPTGVTNLETVWKVKFSSLSTTQYFYNTAPYYSLLLGMNGSKFRFWLSNNTTNWDISSGATGTTTLTTNTWYYVKFTYDGSTYKLYTSTDNSTWTLEVSLSSAKTIGVNYATGRIGHGWTDNPANNTTIDLKESYIKINGQYWWSGFYTKNVIGDKHYALTRRYAKHKVGDFNPSTYTVVGSPTITNAGIVSGCTRDKYLVIPKSFPANVTDLEMVWKFNQGGWGGVILSPREVMDGVTNERSVKLTCAGWFHAYLSSNGTTLDIANSLHSSVLDYNVWYYGKLTYDGSTYNLYISTDNESWTLCDSVSSTKTLAPTDGNLLIGTNGADDIYNGSIDLSESYIKINGEYWWAGFYLENVYGEKYY